MQEKRAPGSGGCVTAPQYWRGGGGGPSSFTPARNRRQGPRDLRGGSQTPVAERTAYVADPTTSDPALRRVIELMLAQSGARIAVGGDHPGEVQVQVQSVGGLGCLLGPTLDTLATQLHYGVMQRVTIAFEGEDLELVEQACRELADRARRDAEAVKGTSVEPVHKSAQARFLGMAERLKVARG